MIVLVKMECDYQCFIYSPMDELVSCLYKNIKIYNKMYITTATAYFGEVTPTSGSALIRAYRTQVTDVKIVH